MAPSNRPIALLSVGLLFLASSACTEGPVGANTPGPATLVPQPVLPATLSEGVFALPVDRVRLLLVRTTGASVLDTLIPFPADSQQVSIRAKVPLLAAREFLTVSLEYRNNKQLLFAGRREIELRQGEGAAPTIPVDYVGPGTDIVSLRLLPRDTAIAPGDSLTFGLVAQSATGVARSYYVGWATSNPVVAPVSAVGTVRAPGRRGGVTVRVLTPNGIRDSTRLWFSPPGQRMEITIGDQQQGVVAQSLPVRLGVRILAADGGGVPGVRVRFGAVSRGGTQDSLVISDSAGMASTVAVLANTSGTYAFTAEAPGLGSLTFSAFATPDAPQRTAIIGGNGQRALAGETLPAPFVVRVTDRFGNTVEGVPLTWSVLEGTGSFADLAVITNTEGEGRGTFVLGAQAGTNRVRVSIPSGASVDFVAIGDPQ